jgi:hypothetical protein
MASAKTAVRAPVREKEKDLKPGEFRSRSGEILRFRPTGGNQFDIPEDLMEEGYTYQWQAQSIYNEPSNDLAQMYANGWRYVTSDSRVGQFFLLPNENADCIVRGGLVLMERPAELTDLYVAETDRLTRLQYEGLMNKSSDLSVPDSFENKGKDVSRERRLVRASKVADELVDAGFGIPDEE